jgi:GNAT superfamily N-acetyltransferase
MSKLDELVVFYQKKGLLETLGRIKSRYLGVLTFVHYQRDLSDQIQKDWTNVDIEIIVNNLALLNKERKAQKNLPREFYIDKTHHGKSFYLLYFQGHLAGICWVFSNGEYSRFFKIEKKSSCELNYIHTLPQYRGKRLLSILVNSVCEDLKSRQLLRVVMSIAEGNPAMINAMKYTGFAEWMRVKSFCSFLIKQRI